jgi:hypothetical protein
MCTGITTSRIHDLVPSVRKDVERLVRRIAGLLARLSLVPGIQDPMAGAGPVWGAARTYHFASSRATFVLFLSFVSLSKIPIVSVDTVFLHRIYLKRFILYTHLLDFRDRVCVCRVAPQQLCFIFGNHLPRSRTFLRHIFPALYGTGCPLHYILHS